MLVNQPWVSLPRVLVKQAAGLAAKICDAQRYALVDRDFLASGRYELEVACDLVPCELQMGALYDPKMTRIKV